MQPSGEGGAERWRPSPTLRQSISVHSVPTMSMHSVPSMSSSSSFIERSPRNSRLSLNSRVPPEIEPWGSQESARLSLPSPRFTSRDRRHPRLSCDICLSEDRPQPVLGAQGLPSDEGVAKPTPHVTITPASRSSLSKTVRVVAPPPSASPSSSKRTGFHSIHSRFASMHSRGTSRMTSRMMSRMTSRMASVMEARAPWCRNVVRHRYFQVVSLIGLVAALALPDLWVLADRPDNTGLDVLLTLVCLFFAFEFIMQIGASRKYPGSFFFWMDMLGASSLMLDISYLPFFMAGEYSSQTIVLTARFAKVGARACRLGRLVRLLRYMPGRPESQEGMVKCMSGRLSQALSVRTSLLIIVTAIITPLSSIWTYPQEDWSLDSWMEILETTSTRSPEQLDEQISQLHAFYSDMAYFPYHLVARLAGSVERVWEPPDVATRGAPARRWNARRLATGHVECHFNFHVPNQREAAVNMALMLVVVLLMAVFSLVLSKTMSEMVIQPLNRLLERISATSTIIFNSVCMMVDNVQSMGQAEPASPTGGVPPRVPMRRLNSLSSEAEAEVEMLHLEEVMDKLSIVARFILGAKDGKDQVEQLTLEGRSLVACFAEEYDEPVNFRRTKGPSVDVQLSVIQSLGLSLELMDSWDLNPLALDKSRNQAACVFFLSSHNHGVSVEPARLQSFLGAVEGSYNNVPYHSWFHAVDVTHSMYRLLKIFHCCLYMSNLERYALLVSAIAHDSGHPGLKNPFLVETSHELALRYNDASPLENMHCQRLFEVLAVPRSNILGGLNRKQFREVRRVCLEAILHTDISLHFQMIKDLQMFYEMHYDLQEAFQFNAVDPEAFPTEESIACYTSQDARHLLTRLLLHLCDLSNPTKPFRISRVWAHRCLDEFFAQGDAELAAGLPVQSLHDRSKTNREYSQIGFIEFLMSPLAFAAAKVLPPYVPCVEQLLDNLRQWQADWVADTGPSAEERAAVEARLQRLEQRFVTSA